MLCGTVGGLCTATVASVNLGLRGFAAEHSDLFQDLAEERLTEVQASVDGDQALFGTCAL